MEQAILMKDVSKSFSHMEHSVLHHINIEIFEGEFITILGASGSGKTTLLKLINRLYDVDKGEILFFGNSIKSIKGEILRRQIGYVIQEVGLFPHYTIKENIEIVPKLLKWEKSKIDKTTTELFALMGLEEEVFSHRYPNQLSGGQQQRVGVARALAANPRLLLMDEPFGAIDPITRRKMQEDLQVIQQKLNKTILFVTHDVEEAFSLGTRVIIMNEGNILQFDTPQNIYQRPANAFVRSLLSFLPPTYGACI